MVLHIVLRTYTHTPYMPLHVCLSVVYFLVLKMGCQSHCARCRYLWFIFTIKTVELVSNLFSLHITLSVPSNTRFNLFIYFPHFFFYLSFSTLLPFFHYGNNKNIKQYNFIGSLTLFWEKLIPIPHPSLVHSSSRSWHERHVPWGFHTLNHLSTYSVVHFVNRFDNLPRIICSHTTDSLVVAAAVA